MPRRSGKFVKRESSESGTIDKYFKAETTKRKAEETTCSCVEVCTHQALESAAPMSVQVSKRRQQFEVQSQWIPISNVSCAAATIGTLLVSPLTTLRVTEGVRSTFCSSGGVSSFRFQNYFVTPLADISSPLPAHLAWGDPKEVWHGMLKRESKYCRDRALLSHHPCLQARMRSILLDWIIEVCEVYLLHRQTFYLTVDFIDRYLSANRDIQKAQLQLIGVTALFIAAKAEEIYPPKLADFAYVTDGACTENDIIDQELIMLKVLNWDLNPVTMNSWMTAYLQLLNSKGTDYKADVLPSTAAMDDEDSRLPQETSFLLPLFSGQSYIQIARLMDLCVLDLECLQFPYSVMATSALYHASSEQVALRASGYCWGDIAACVSWMSPFAITARECGTARLKVFDNIASEDTHNIQTHVIDLHLLEVAQSRRAQVELAAARSSPDLRSQNVPECVLTPPPSHQKKSFLH